MSGEIQPQVHCAFGKSQHREKVGLKLGAIQSVSDSYAYPVGITGPLQPVVTVSAIERFAAQ